MIDVIAKIILDEDQIKLLIKTFIKLLFGPVLVAINIIVYPDKLFAEYLLGEIFEHFQIEDDISVTVVGIVVIVYWIYVLYATFIVPVRFYEEFQEISLSSGSSSFAYIIPSTPEMAGISVILIGFQIFIKLFFFLIKWVICVIVMIVQYLRLIFTCIVYLVEFIISKTDDIKCRTKKSHMTEEESIEALQNAIKQLNRYQEISNTNHSELYDIYIVKHDDDHE